MNCLFEFCNVYDALVTFCMQTLVIESFSCKIHVGTHTHTPTFVTNAFEFGVAAGIMFSITAHLHAIIE